MASLLNYLKRFFNTVWSHTWRFSLWRRVWLVVLAVIVGFAGLSYGIAEWYIHRHNSEPLTLGTSFIADYAESFGVDPKATLDSILGDLNVKQVRLVSYWDKIETQPGKYDFSGLDWQFAMANKYGARVSLAIGLRQPRWPECHQPSWVVSEPKTVWQPQLSQFITAVVNHYRGNPALNAYELENEFFMKVFGKCTDFDRNRLVSEYELVKQTDPVHPVIVSRSDNWVGIPIGKPVPDQFAISVYKRVWDATITHRYFEYPLPSWFYASLAGYEQLYSGKDMIIHELQAEPWPPNGQDITATPLAEQFKSMNADRLKSRIVYAENTGMRTIDLWGAEWWYWLKVKQNDPSVWNVVKQAVAEAQAKNHQINSR